MSDRPKEEITDAEIASAIDRYEGAVAAGDDTERRRATADLAALLTHWPEVAFLHHRHAYRWDGTAVHVHSICRIIDPPRYFTMSDLARMRRLQDRLLEHRMDLVESGSFSGLTEDDLRRREYPTLETAFRKALGDRNRSGKVALSSAKPPKRKRKGT